LKKIVPNVKTQRNTGNLIFFYTKTPYWILMNNAMSSKCIHYLYGLKDKNVRNNYDRVYTDLIRPINRLAEIYSA